MPIYWASPAGQQAASAVSTQAQQQIAAGLAFLGWVIAAGVGWWYDNSTPPAPDWVYITNWTPCEPIRWEYWYGM